MHKHHLYTIIALLVCMLAIFSVCSYADNIELVNVPKEEIEQPLEEEPTEQPVENEPTGETVEQPLEDEPKEEPTEQLVEEEPEEEPVNEDLEKNVARIAFLLEFLIFGIIPFGTASIIVYMGAKWFGRTFILF